MKRRSPQRQTLLPFSVTPTAPSRGVLTGRVYASASDVREALSVIDLSGACGLLAGWREADRIAEGRHPGGRKPTFTDRHVLTLMLLVTRAGQAQTVRNMAALAAYGLDEESVELLDLHIENLTPQVVYDRMYFASRNLLRIINPYDVALPQHRNDR